MVQSRRDPTISSSEFTAPLDDDVPQRVGGPPPAKGKKPASQPSPPVTASKGGLGLAIFAFVIAAIGVGVGAFAVWKNTQLLAELSSASNRIGELEKRLTLSDDEASQSVTVLQANLKQAVVDIGKNESEIRKLWDTRNVNRKAISQNTDSVKAVESGLQKSVDELNKSLSTFETQQRSLTANVDILTTSTGAIEKDIAALKQQLATVNEMSEKLSTIDQLNRRVKGNEEAIEAIDSYRLNINRQLLELQQRVGTTP